MDKPASQLTKGLTAGLIGLAVLGVGMIAVFFELQRPADTYSLAQHVKAEKISLFIRSDDPKILAFPAIARRIDYSSLPQISSGTTFELAITSGSGNGWLLFRHADSSGTGRLMASAPSMSGTYVSAMQAGSIRTINDLPEYQRMASAYGNVIAFYPNELFPPTEEENGLIRNLLHPYDIIICGWNSVGHGSIILSMDSSTRPQLRNSAVQPVTVNGAVFSMHEQFPQERIAEIYDALSRDNTGLGEGIRGILSEQINSLFGESVEISTLAPLLTGPVTVTTTISGAFLISGTTSDQALPEQLAQAFADRKSHVSVRHLPLGKFTRTDIVAELPAKRRTINKAGWTVHEVLSGNDLVFTTAQNNRRYLISNSGSLIDANIIASGTHAPTADAYLNTDVRWLLSFLDSKLPFLLSGESTINSLLSSGRRLKFSLSDTANSRIIEWKKE